MHLKLNEVKLFQVELKCMFIFCLTRAELVSNHMNEFMTV